MGDLSERERKRRAIDRRMAENLAKDPDAPGNPAEALERLGKTAERAKDSFRRFSEAVDAFWDKWEQR